MEFLSALWQPIVIAAVLVFIVSSLVHMVFGWHKADCRALPNEEAVRNALRSPGLSPGFYMTPWADSPKACGTPEMKAKFEQGPVAHVTVLPNGMPVMGKFLSQWFVYTLLVGALTAYVAWHALGAGAPYLTVFRITGAVSFGIYGLSAMVDAIWKGQQWGSAFKFIFDGLLYALVTAGAFGWRWPPLGV
jgi:hypothetical protein